ncbi:phage tail tube protein [Micromonospora sp. HUAS LYJ1]|uniref:phage tail tube protein n=1 Tax=Micromonospora sp. HUAS LYJ1 TaxID=3061626 RepID=UPI002671D96B|nr:IPT/TIG domain-containing protein [Micromonospora sp. HUAS LYJ1]WKU08013.1 IPT/TIG domain-containing protein [Micromonospora sp. HUAS LYJ1]
MTSPVSSLTALARRFAVEIDLNPSGTADWQPLLGMEELKTVFTPRREDDEAYDDAGAMRRAVTGSEWALEIKLIHRTGPDGLTMLAVQEHLRVKSEAADAMTGEAHVRWYDRSGVGEAWDGRCLVDWTPDGGKGRDTVSVRLSGQGARVAITNPNASTLPVVASLAPTGGGTAGGTIVEIRGRKLTGATAVTFGGTAATSFRVVSDTLIIAISPAKTAGSVDVLVTTPGGTSANTAADNFLYA